MKALALVLATVVSTALLAAGIVVLVLATPRGAGDLAVLGGASMSTLVYGPLILGSLLAYFDPRRSAAAKRSFTKWAAVVLGIEVVGAIGLVVYTVLAHAAFWVPIVFVVAGVLLLAVAYLVAAPLRRYDERQDHKLPLWSPVSRDQITRKIVRVALTFVVAFVVVLLALLVLTHGLHGHENWVALSLIFGFEFASISAGIACIIVVLPLNRQLRASVNRDLGTVRKFARVVLRNKNDELVDQERVHAARYAATLAVTLPFTLGYITLLYAGIITQSLWTAFNGDSISFLSGGYVVFLVVILFAIYPLQIVRIRRARKYVRDHDDLLAPEPAPAA